ncbi:hypothetical protein [Paenibacillus koleovorans]|uniref:hypothetical protein n=1 Tax=Paenibacillus koleovorans TaxID=121608 RepID=UPI000FDAF733|nr:hypothetical protein [Paenibacillus koleovorans]
MFYIDPSGHVWKWVGNAWQATKTFISNEVDAFIEVNSSWESSLNYWSMGLIGKIQEISQNDPWSLKNVIDNAELFMYMPALKLEGKAAEALSKEISVLKTYLSDLGVRRQYYNEIQDLGAMEQSMRSLGVSSENIARSMHQARRELGVKYKNLTSSEQLKAIYARNLEKYGDKLGPTFEWLINNGKSYDDIIESSKRTSKEFNALAGIE